MPVIIPVLVISSSFALVGLDFTHINRRNKRFIFDVFCLILVFLAASKGPNTCFDTNNYVTLYDKAPELANFVPYLDGYEPGWVLLGILCRTLGMNFHIFFFIVAGIAIGIYRYVILEKCKNIFIALFTYVSCFYFLNEIVCIRHGLATALVFLEMYLLSEDKKKKALLCCFLAVMFHSVGAVGFLLLFIKNKDNPIRFYFLIPLAIFINDGLLIRLLQIVARFFDNSFLGMVSRKVTNYTELENSAGGMKTLILYSLDLLVVFLLMYNEKKHDVINMFYSQMSIGLVLSAVFMLSLSQVASFARINALFLTSRVPLSSACFEKYKTNKNEFIVVICLIIIDLYIFVRQNFLNSSGQGIFY